jgi:hypothetical protein
LSTVAVYKKTWQEVATKTPSVLDADLIVSTIASWPNELALSEWARAHAVPLVIGWVEPHAAAGHAVSLKGKCLACHFSPYGHFDREVAKWERESPIRLADGCHEHFLPYGYANIVPTQSLIARLALEVVRGESVEPTHRALLPSPEILRALGARASDDSIRQRSGASLSMTWVEHSRPWPTNPHCWHCQGAE